MKNKFFLFITFVLLGVFAANAQVKTIQNQLFSDNKTLHFGFTLGMHFQDFGISHSNAVDANGNSYYMEVPTYRPGFTVGVISDLKIFECLNLRFVPTLNFGDRKLVFNDQNGVEQPDGQILKSTIINMPFYLKFRAKRVNNFRPYILAGTGVSVDVAREKGEFILLKALDMNIEFGVGCDFYLPYFKFAPELKFCVGMFDLLERDRGDLAVPADVRYTHAISKLTSRLIVLTFNFE